MKGRVTKTGYRRNSPDVNNDYNVIPSNRISMAGVDFPVLGVDNLGNSELMYPGGEYEFQGDYVTELPAYGSGGLTQWFAEKWVDIKTGKECGRSGKDKNGRPYPACRPSKRVNSTTPKTSKEMSAKEKAKFKKSKTSGKRINYNHKRAQEGIEVEPASRRIRYEDGRIKLQDPAIYDGMLDETTVTPYTQSELAWQEARANQSTGGLEPIYPIFEVLSAGAGLPLRSAGRTITKKATQIPAKLMPTYRDMYRGLDLDGTSSYVLKNAQEFKHVSNNPNLRFGDIKTTDPISIGRRPKSGRRINRNVAEGNSDPRNALAGFYTTAVEKEIGERAAIAGSPRAGQSIYKFSMPEGARVLEIPRGTTNMSTGELKEAADMGYDLIRGNDLGTGVEYIPLNKNKMMGFGISSNPIKAYGGSLYKAQTGKETSLSRDEIFNIPRTVRYENSEMVFQDKPIWDGFLNEVTITPTTASEYAWEENRANQSTGALQPVYPVFDAMTLGAGKGAKEFVGGVADLGKFGLREGVDLVHPVGRSLRSIKTDGIRKGLSPLEIKKNQMAQVGITSAQRKAYVPGVSEIFTEYIHPYSYNNPVSRVLEIPKKIIKGNKNSKKIISQDDFVTLRNNLGEIPEAVADTRYDAWRLYSGIPQKNNTFRVANTAPVNHPSYSKNQLDNLEIFSFNEQERLLRNLQPMSPNQKVIYDIDPQALTNDLANLKENLNTLTALKNNKASYAVDGYEMGVMGGYNRRVLKGPSTKSTSTKGATNSFPAEQGVKAPQGSGQSLLEYNDIWDLDLNGLAVEKYFGKPFLSHGQMPVSLDPVEKELIKYIDRAEELRKTTINRPDAKFKELLNNFNLNSYNKSIFNKNVNKYDGGSIPEAQEGIEVKGRMGVRPNADGTKSTHLMSREYVDGKGWVAFPTLFQNPDSSWVDMSQDTSFYPAYKEAMKRGEVYEFGEDLRAAKRFADEGSWKKEKYQTGRQVGPPSLTPGPIQDKVYPMVTGPVEDSLENRIINSPPAKSKKQVISSTNGVNVDPDRLRKGIKYAESLNGTLMMNPESTATGFYGQLFSEVKGKQFLKNIDRETFAADTALQNQVFNERLKGNKELFGIKKGLIDNGIDIYNEYKPILKDKLKYSPTELAALSNMLGRQGAREYVGYVLRDGKTLAEALPKIYGPNAKYKNHTPEEYIEKFNKAFNSEKPEVVKPQNTSKGPAGNVTIGMDIYDYEKGGEPIPVYNTYNSKNRAWLAARKNLGRGKQFMYGGKVYSTSTPNGL